MDNSLPSYSLEAEKYHQLARAALFHYSLFDEPTITAVQALVCHTAPYPHFYILNERSSVVPDDVLLIFGR